MKLLFNVYCRQETGFGHWYRSLALARTAAQRGHTVTVASDRHPGPGLSHIPTAYNDPGSFKRAVEATQPDWVFVDLPGTPPVWIREMVRGRICTLNGIGYNQFDGADLRVIQGATDVQLPGPQDKVPVLKGIEYVILRPELEQFKGRVRGQDVLVWEGAYPSGLLQRFPVACPGTFATLVVSEMKTAPLMVLPTQVWVRPKPEGTELLEWLAGARGLVCDMGMICMEGAFLKLPQWVFSSSSLHLKFAKGLDRAGLIKAWDGVGLPSNSEIKEFINTSFEPTGTPPDLEGASRVMEVVENYA